MTQQTNTLKTDELFRQAEKEQAAFNGEMQGLRKIAKPLFQIGRLY